MDKDLIYFKKIIESKGYKFTKQKQCILELLIKSNIHLNAEEIYKNLKANAVSLTTVYRSLKIFSEANIVKDINVNGTCYYEMKIFSGKPLHIHFKCYKCNNIIDINSQRFNLEYLKLNNKIEEENNLEIYDSNIMFIGLCGRCREELKCQDQQNSGE